MRCTAATLSTLVALALGEGLVRALAPQRTAYTGAAMMAPDPDCGHVLVAGHRHGGVAINAQGMRDVERPQARLAGERRVLVLGDSFAFGAVALEDTFPRALARELGPGVDVLNAGVPAYSTRHEAAWLRKFGLGLSPDAVVVGFFVGNDPWENAGEEVHTVVDGELVVKDARRARSALRRLYNRSHLYRLLRGLPSRLREVLGGEPALERGYHRLERKRMGVCATGGAAATWEAGWRVSREKLAEVRDLVTPAPVVVLVIPDEFQVDASLRVAVLRRYDMDPAGYDWDSPQRRVARICEELGLERVDVLEECRRRTAAGERLYKPLDSHWSEAGNLLAARRLAASAALAALAGCASGPPQGSSERR